MATSINNRQALSFTFNKGLLVVNDLLDEYDDIDITNYICLEYITHGNNLINAVIHENLTSSEDIQISKILLQEDGMLNYHRFVIPRLRKYAGSRVINPFNLFYYKRKFYYALEQVVWKDIDFRNQKLFVEVPMNELYKVLSTGLDLRGDNEVVYSKYIIFSYELLKKAFVNAQDDLAKNRTLKNIYSFIWMASGREKRDMLLNTVLAIREYLNRGDYSTPDLIIESLYNNSCLGVQNSSSSNEPLCGCSSVNSSATIAYEQEITTDDLVIINTNWTFGETFPILLS